MIFDMPRESPFFDSTPGFGEVSALPGSPATSEKKNEVLTVGVRGVLGIPLGVLSMEPKPPGEKRPLAVGDCNHARTVKDITITHMRKDLQR
jgi:hypothetical protein